MTSKLAERFLAALATVLAWAASATAQTVVVGTGDPDIDVPAVQAAVDRGGEIILMRHFSFERPPTIPPPPPPLDGFGPATVLISRAVSISGLQDECGEMASIEGGQIPFEVEALGSSVTIQGLRFIRPKQVAIAVFAVSGLVIASCKIEGVEPFPQPFSEGIAIATTFGIPTPEEPGHPENISGTLLVVNNDIDVGGTAFDNTLGAIIFSVGVPGAEVEAYVSANAVTNTTERSINIYWVGGRTYIERNVITTSAIVGRSGALDVIHVSGLGSYLIAGNSVHSRWAAGGGIRLHGGGVERPMERAIVVNNDVYMEAPKGTVFDINSAGISLRSNAQGTVVLNNRIRGRAREALAAEVQFDLAPADNALVLNRFDDFEPSLADVFVGESVMNTLIVGPGPVEDHGVGTLIVPLQ